MRAMLERAPDAVIFGDKPGSKYNKALSLGVPVWDEAEFLRQLAEAGYQGS